MTSPKVSIITVFLNGENFLAEAIESVLSQTFSDWEYILVDDGSTDRSTAIARQATAADPRVRYLTFEDGRNHGVAEARVLGSNSAIGEYLLFLDHDDLLQADALERLVSALDAEPGAGAVFAATRFWAFDPTLSVPDSEQSFVPFAEGRVEGRAMLQSLIRSDLHHPANCSTLFCRSAYLAARDAIPLYPGMYEETAILFSLLARGDITLIDEVVSAYRMHAASMCHRAKADGTLADTGYSRDRERFLRWTARHVPLDFATRFLALRVLLRDRLRHALGR